MPARVLLAFLLLALAAAPPALAAPADLDPGFAGDGTFVTASGGTLSPTRMTPHPDGGTIVTGPANGGAAAVLKLRSDGQPDPAFGGGDGMVLVGAGPGYISPGAATVLPDGRLLVPGSYRVAVGDVRVVIARMTPAGEPDPELDADGDTNGTVIHDLPGSGREGITSVVLLPDGRFWASGGMQVGGVTQPLLARFGADGAFDAGYDGDGYAVTPLPGYAGGGMRSLTRLPDGRMLVVGTVEGAGEDRAALVRYTAEGVPDAVFGTGGLAVLDTGPGSAGLTDLAVSPGGAAVVAGYDSDGMAATGIVARVTPEGSLDGAFGEGGIARVAAPGEAFTLLSGVALLPDGRIAVTGFVGPLSPRKLVVARLRRGGALDDGFGVGGMTTIDLPEGDDELGADVLAHADGRLLVLGQVTTPAGDELAVIGLRGSAPDTDEDGLPDASDPCVDQAGPGGCPPPPPPASPAPPAPPAEPGPGGGAGGAVPGNPRATRDTAAPRITGARLVRARTRRTGPRFRLTLSEAATVRIAVVRQASGRRLRTLTRRAPRAGRIHLPLARRGLRPGGYRAVITATDAAGNRSGRVTVRFRVQRAAG